MRRSITSEIMFRGSSRHYSLKMHLSIDSFDSLCVSHPSKLDEDLIENTKGIRIKLSFKLKIDVILKSVYKKWKKPLIFELMHYVTYHSFMHWMLIQTPHSNTISPAHKPAMDFFFLPVLLFLSLSLHILNCSFPSVFWNVLPYFSDISLFSFCLWAQAVSGSVLAVAPLNVSRLFHFPRSSCQW